MWPDKRVYLKGKFNCTLDDNVFFRTFYWIKLIVKNSFSRIVIKSHNVEIIIVACIWCTFRLQFRLFIFIFFFYVKCFFLHYFYFYFNRVIVQHKNFRRPSLPLITNYDLVKNYDLVIVCVFAFCVSLSLNCF